MRSKSTLFFSPHQDDELLTLGGGILQELDQGRNVQVVLCVDGSKSGVRGMLANREACAWHRGKHRYAMSEERFNAARDKEFVDSCKALGVPSANVHIDDGRAIDGTETVQHAEQTMLRWLARFPGCHVATVSPLAGPGQHRDHKALGNAALRLFSEGRIASLDLFIDPYFIDDFRSENPDIDPVAIEVLPQFSRQIEQASKAYRLWSPWRGRYAIGVHSVGPYFDEVVEHGLFYKHSVESADTRFPPEGCSPRGMPSA